MRQDHLHMSLKLVQMLKDVESYTELDYMHQFPYYMAPCTFRAT